MTRLAILTAEESHRFDQPPTLSDDERQLYFNVATDAQSVINRIKQPTNKAGFVLQLGYFRAAGKFFMATEFKSHDIEYVCHLLQQDTINFSHYTGTVLSRHRRIILALLNWQVLNDASRQELSNEARRYVANQVYSKHIFFGLVDMCWKRQWIIPAYYELAEIITNSFNAADSELLCAVERALTPAHIAKLEALLQPIGNSVRSRSVLPITQLKTINQSSSPGEIKSSLEVLNLYRDHFMGLVTAMDSLPLSDKATDYYATWLQKTDYQQLSQFTNRYKAYLYLLAFIKHQFYQRQDNAIDVLLKAVTAARHAVNGQMIKRDQANKPERTLAISALIKAHQSASAFASGIVAIVNAEGMMPSEKYYKIESLVNEYSIDIEPDRSRFKSLDEDTVRNLKNVSFYESLEKQSVKLQRRVAGIVRTVAFDPYSSDKDLLNAIDHFKVTGSRLGPHPPTEFLNKKEREAVYRNDVLITPLYKSLLFFRIAQGIKSGHLNLHHSYRYRAIQDYLISPSEWKENKIQILKETNLAEYADGENVLANLKGTLDERYCTVNDNFLAGKNPYMSVNADGRCRVRTPKTDYEDHSFIGVISPNRRKSAVV